MLDMGFRPAVDRIVAPHAAQPPDAVLLRDARGRRRHDRQRLHDATRAATSTCPPSTTTRRDRAPLRARSSTRPRSTRSSRELRDDERGLTIVFVRTKRGADRLVKRLQRPQRRPRVAMHGDKTQSQREKALARFERGEVDTLVATDVAARGIDVRDVTHVINYDMPEDRDGYVHRIGRTGRAGRAGHRRDVRARRPGARHEPDRDRPRPAQGVLAQRHADLDAAAAATVRPRHGGGGAGRAAASAAASAAAASARPPARVARRRVAAARRSLRAWVSVSRGYRAPRPSDAPARVPARRAVAPRSSSPPATGFTRGAADARAVGRADDARRRAVGAAGARDRADAAGRRPRR